MTDADARLKAMFAADVPPAMDARFRLDALERIERRRLFGRLALVALAGGAATAGTVLLGPQLTMDIGREALIVTSVLISLVATTWGVMQMRRPI